MELIQMAREMGKALQSDERYIKMQIARQACDADQELQTEIAAFEIKKDLINIEAQKDVRDEETIRKLNEEFRKLYGDILKNQNMTIYNETKTAFDSVFQEVNGILSMSAEGEDPATCVYLSNSCDGSCNGCSGCS